MSLHPFEAAGLGQAPFALDELDYSVGGTTCDYCGQKIHYIYWLLGARAQTHFESRERGTIQDSFKVGSDCVKKVDKRLGRDCARALQQYKEDAAMSDEEREFYDGFERIR